MRVLLIDAHPALGEGQRRRSERLVRSAAQSSPTCRVTQRGRSGWALWEIGDAEPIMARVLALMLPHGATVRQPATDLEAIPPY